jgi:hypothetical protein
MGGGVGALRRALLALIALDAAMIGGRVLSYRPLLAMPGVTGLLLELAILRTAHAVLVIRATEGGGPAWSAAVRTGTVFGLVAAAVESAHIAVENLVPLALRGESMSTGAFMLALCLTWATAGHRGARAAGSTAAGALTGAWSASVGMLATLAFAFSQLYWSLPALERRQVGSPDLIRSGWTDLRAFTIADIGEAGVKVLLVGPVAGAMLGGFGGLLQAISRFSTRRSVS